MNRLAVCLAAFALALAIGGVPRAESRMSAGSQRTRNPCLQRSRSADERGLQREGACCREALAAGQGSGGERRLAHEVAGHSRYVRCLDRGGGLAYEAVRNDLVRAGAPGVPGRDAGHLAGPQDRDVSSASSRQCLVRGRRRHPPRRSPLRAHAGTPPVWKEAPRLLRRGRTCSSRRSCASCREQYNRLCCAGRTRSRLDRGRSCAQRRDQWPRSDRSHSVRPAGSAADDLHPRLFRRGNSRRDDPRWAGRSDQHHRLQASRDRGRRRDQRVTGSATGWTSCRRPISLSTASSSGPRTTRSTSRRRRRGADTAAPAM